MRWDRSHQSPDVDDRRGAGGGFGGGGAGLGLLLPLLGRFGWKGILIGLVILGIFHFAGDCGGPATEQRGAASRGSGAGADELSRFVGYVLDDNQAHWAREFEREGKQYKRARLVIFEDGVDSSCGTASSAVGPFYCPLDQQVYIDLSFYRLLQSRFGAPGDFAQAYVIAHEVGHHVQNLHDKLGRGGGSGRESIATELQADCLAGAWAHDAEKRKLLEAGDLDEGMTAAAAVGDDAIQRQTEGQVRPETWTHGSSEQRKRAFRKGYEGGTLEACGL
ncbi:MAG TPA: neutral zinc metallopeptidase [Kofleriaceae bacterium]|nr:neutral zinc metallopeptidase [Kofleriaceae bacterium]